MHIMMRALVKLEVLLTYMASTISSGRDPNVAALFCGSTLELGCLSKDYKFVGAPP
jgi:hypothetical protein